MTSPSARSSQAIRVAEAPGESTAAPESVYVLLRDDGTIAGIARFPYEPPRSTTGWAVQEYLADPDEVGAECSRLEADHLCIRDKLAELLDDQTIPVNLHGIEDAIDRLVAAPRLVEATINEDTGVRTVIFATARGRHTFTTTDGPEDVWSALTPAVPQGQEEGPTVADMYRAMGRYRDDGGEYVVALGGVRTRREAAEEDRAAALGAEETWVDEATWTRVDAQGQKEVPTDGR